MWLVVFNARMNAESVPVQSADLAWMLVASALVLLMTPALACFYAGMVRSKNALNTMMMSVVALGPVALVWALAGYSLAFAPGHALVGALDFLALRGVDLSPHHGMPHLLFMAFQGTFAVITTALISGALVERLRFPVYLAFISIWLLVVYAPVAHWIWGGGFLAGDGALDFAGGTVIHVNAAAAAWVAALVVGPRRDYGRQAMLPHSVPLTLMGTGLLWFGWFGFNAGSALGANASAALAFVNTLLAPAAALTTWIIIDLVRSGRATAIGAATAVVVGLVVITPAAGYVGPLAAVAMGVLGVVPSYVALILRARTRLDDSLDVVAAHGLGGATGALLTGVFADPVWSGGPAGLLAGHPDQVRIQVVGLVVVIAYSAAATFLVLRGMALVVALRDDARTEGIGMDVTQHGEEAYTTGDGAILITPGDRLPRPSATAAPALSGEAS
jgi:Amt family ammonium transporter